MLSSEQRRKIRETVEKRLEDIEPVIKSLKKPKGANPSAEPAPARDVDNKGPREQNLNTALLTREYLKDVLKNIEEEDFGLCVWCHSPIAFDLLLAAPDTTRCVRCA
jgi:RNA polymerase-binding transcription factor DksA